MAITRQGGTLFEETDETLRGRLEQMGMEGSAVTDQATAQALGASPDSTKMIGTKAQKTPVLQAQVAKESTLAGATALDQGRQAALPAEQAAMLKAQQLQQLGSLSMRVQDLVESRIQGVSGAETGVVQTPAKRMASIFTSAFGEGFSEDSIKQGLANPDSDIAKIQAKLLNLSLAEPGSDEAQRILVDLGNGIGEGGKLKLTPEQALAMLDTSGSATGRSAAGYLQDTVKLGELDFTQMGFDSADQVAEMLGITTAELAEMKLPEFHEKVSNVQQQEYSEAASLKAKLAALPKGSAQREVIQQQLKDLGQVGVTVMEHKIAQTADEIDRADQVTMGGHTYSVDELLEDDKISAMVQDYIYASDEEKERMFPAAKFGDLRNWIDSNQLALADIARGLGETSEGFRTTQENWQNLGNLPGGISLDADTLTAMGIGYTPDSLVTSAEVAAMQEAIANSNIGQTLTSMTGEEARLFAGKLNPDTVEQLKDLSVEQIKTASDYADLYEDTNFQSLLGLKPPYPAFITDPAMQDDFDAAKATIEMLTKNGDTEWISDPDFQQLAPQQQQTLAENPDRYDEFTSFNVLQRDIEHLGDNPSVEDVIRVMLQDQGFDSGSLITTYDDLNKLARLGDPKAIALRDKWKGLFDLDGEEGITDADAGLLLDRLRNGLNGVTIDSVIGGVEGMPEDVKSLRDQVDQLFATLKTVDGTKTDAAIPSSTLFQTAMSFLDDDNSVSTEEFLSLSPADREKFLREIAPSLGGADSFRAADQADQRAQVTELLSGVNNNPINQDFNLLYSDASELVTRMGSASNPTREAYLHPIENIAALVTGARSSLAAYDTALMTPGLTSAQKDAIRTARGVQEKRVRDLEAYQKAQVIPEEKKADLKTAQDLIKTMNESYYKFRNGNKATSAAALKSFKAQMARLQALSPGWATYITEGEQDAFRTLNSAYVKL